MENSVLYYRSTVSKEFVKVLSHNHIEVLFINENGKYGMEKIIDPTQCAIRLFYLIKPFSPYDACTAKDFEYALGSLIAGLQGLLPEYQPTELEEIPDHLQPPWEP